MFRFVQGWLHWVCTEMESLGARFRGISLTSSAFCPEFAPGRFCWQKDKARSPEWFVWQPALSACYLTALKLCFDAALAPKKLLSDCKWFCVLCVCVCWLRVGCVVCICGPNGVPGSGLGRWQNDTGRLNLPRMSAPMVDIPRVVSHLFIRPQ